ncbi:hypothetical protein BX616_003595 [Lobosporangium transversale]|uniref:USP8 dimerisation domain-containing protein n=1 Tax=Lobosporangium transversale TaxID=64571 RepID=A0A1Y2GJT5_9FUNG|nr:hypothetical protein BCR41DRAFT_397425 [Lobosporangium transversale]KAF9898800.1 hypothetical protein BX616_003595 [Lobosporangium transversale]ORZ13002.1 hypothetical protein BCR41DRAFT_397425 [Lobosporangium transversale]|eukprot:XP_021880351.1 hypothetical protein BCR41DRAFT_397425 [Lobosporangium transversale]
MEMECMVLPPKARLYELKCSADFSSEEFSYSIKTWTNMASLLIKQGNKAESIKDDEYAYISYVRACLIITKVIPHQPQYSAMMNDIACIDLRQKILSIIARIGHLERRLLKRFEQENQERLAEIQRSEAEAEAAAAAVAAAFATPETTMSTISTEYDSDSPVSELAAGETAKLMVRRASFSQGSDEDRREEQADDDEEEEEEEEEEEQEDVVEVRFEIPSDRGLALELNSQIYASNPHRRTLTGNDDTWSTSSYGDQQRLYHPQHQLQYVYQVLEKRSHESLPTLKKKSSNEDERLLISPGCQPNYSALAPPSAMFARQEGAHVRRCSSTDAIRSSAFFPADTQLPYLTATQQSTTTQKPAAAARAVAPAVPRRSSQRGSAAAPLVMAAVSRSSKNSHNGGSYDTVPEHTCSAPTSSILDCEGDRTVYTRETPKSQLNDHRTMSINDSNSFRIRSSTSPITSSPLSFTSSTRKISFLKESSSVTNLLRSLPSTPRASIDRLEATQGASSSPSAVVPSLGSADQSPVPSSAFFTPSTSPQLKSNSPHMHHHSYSLTSIVPGSTSPDVNSISSSTTSLLLSEPPLDLRAQVQTATNATTTPTNPSPTQSSVTTFTTGKISSGLLRKIRSRPKMKEQLFEMIVGPTPSLPMSASPPMEVAEHIRQHSNSHHQHSIRVVV